MIISLKYISHQLKKDYLQIYYIIQGFFSGVSGAEIRPHSQWKLGDFFPNFDQKKKKKKIPITAENNSQQFLNIVKVKLLFEMMFNFDYKLLFNALK